MCVFVGLAGSEDDGQVQILTVGHSSNEDGDGECAMSCTHSQSKQDLRVTMLKKGIDLYGHTRTHARTHAHTLTHTHSLTAILEHISHSESVSILHFLTDIDLFDRY